MVDNILVEKYRPEIVSEIVGQNHIRVDLLNFAKTKNIPHLLFYGTAGTGKTTTAIALAKEILGDVFYVNFLELNASDSRKIEHVRNTIKVYAKQAPMQADYRIILLDEVDSMGIIAQMALKRIMEKFTKNCRFILTCNHIHKLDDAIISRCATYNFLPLKPEDIRNRLGIICEKENIKADVPALSYIADNCGGDIRRAIIRLQSISTSGVVSMDSVYSDRIEGNFLFLVKSLFKDMHWTSSRQAFNNVRQEGIDTRELILRLHNYVIAHPDLVPGSKIGRLTGLFRNAEVNLILGTTPQLEIDAMLFDIQALLVE